VNHCIIIWLEGGFYSPFFYYKAPYNTFAQNAKLFGDRKYTGVMGKSGVTMFGVDFAANPKAIDTTFFKAVEKRFNGHLEDRRTYNDVGIPTSAIKEDNFRELITLQTDFMTGSQYKPYINRLAAEIGNYRDNITLALWLNCMYALYNGVVYYQNVIDPILREYKPPTMRLEAMINARLVKGANAAVLLRTLPSQTQSYLKKRLGATYYDQNGKVVHKGLVKTHEIMGMLLSSLRAKSSYAEKIIDLFDNKENIPGVQYFRQMQKIKKELLSFDNSSSKALGVKDQYQENRMTLLPGSNSLGVERTSDMFITHDPIRDANIIRDRESCTLTDFKRMSRYVSLMPG